TASISWSARPSYSATVRPVEGLWVRYVLIGRSHPDVVEGIWPRPYATFPPPPPHTAHDQLTDAGVRGQIVRGGARSPPGEAGRDPSPRCGGLELTGQPQQQVLTSVVGDQLHTQRQAARIGAGGQ